MDNEINTYVIDFPDTEPKEMITPNSDGSYTIFINARQSSEQQKKSWLHAMMHIANHDFEKENVQNIETDARK